MIKYYSIFIIYMNNDFMFNLKTKVKNNIVGISNLKSNVNMFNRNSIITENKNTNKPLNRIKILNTSIKDNFKLNISDTIITYKNIKIIKLTSEYVVDKSLDPAPAPTLEQGDPATPEPEPEPKPEPEPEPEPEPVNTVPLPS